ncbi:hypothetical protein ANCCEY_02836 [Ancylostoma ceylanicum]|uniref:Uncharacterized protein n=1 Tax=Ancylostoma ceylanicum TaxID=53326 RepID=A0A0D6M3I5_9BILA|nr:hypothetical protein ANCCEY_02836 [Ancylostoma ceylanicum]
MKTGALLFFDDVTDAHEDNFREIITDMYNCLAGDVKKVASETLKDFKRLYRELQSSYTNLFKKELAEYLEKFKFGSEFVRCFQRKLRDGQCVSSSNAFGALESR